MTDFLYLIILISITYGIGRRLLSLFAKEPLNRLDDFVFSSGLGLGLLGYLVYIIGSLSFLYLKYVLIMLFICALIALLPFVRLISGISFKELLNSAKNLTPLEKFLMAAAIAIGIVSIFGAIAPEIGNDALAYHLYHPKVFIQNHRIDYIPFTRESMWPYLTEMLFTLGLILKSAALAKLFHYLLGVLSAMAVFSFTRRFFSKRQALMAAALFYSAPGIFMQSTYAYVDLSLCFYSFTALYAMALWSEEKKGWYILLSGIFAGLALSVKILGGIGLIALYVVMAAILISTKENPKQALKAFFIFSISAFCVSCIWYIRSYITTGSPVYPFFHGIFKAGMPDIIGRDLGQRKDLIGFIRLPWDMVMHIDSFGGEQIGVISLAFLPFLFFAPFKRNAVLRYLLFFLISYSIIWLIVSPNIRFTFVNFAVLYILISIGFFSAADKFRLPIIRLLLAVCLLFNVSLCLYYNRDKIGLMGRAEKKEVYLFKKERTYPIAEFINENLPSESIIIVAGEPRFFYFNRSMVLYHIWRRASGEDISMRIEKLKSGSKPVYLLRRGDAGSAEVDNIAKGKPVVYKSANYSLYRL